MLNLLLLIAVVAGHPPRLKAYPWALMVGSEQNGTITWKEQERFLEGRDCALEASHYRIAECIREMDYV